MGIDVNLYVEGEIADGELEAAETFMQKRVSRLGWDDQDDPNLLVRNECEPRVEFQTYSRYYGTGYPRGYWPFIYAAIVAMRAAFPERKVFYGGDVSDTGMEATDEYLATLWEHWLSPKGV